MRTRFATNTAAAGDVPQASPSEGQPPISTDPRDVASTRAGRTWVKLVPGLALLAVILVFVFGNMRSTKVSFATASARLPLALALLAAAALGGLLVFALGSIRIMQLRKAIRRSPSNHRP